MEYTEQTVIREARELAPPDSSFLIGMLGPSRLVTTDQVARVQQRIAVAAGAVRPEDPDASNKNKGKGVDGTQSTQTSDPESGAFRATVCRRYVADLTTSSPFTGNADVWTRGILYEVRPRSENLRKLMQIGDAVEAPDSSVPTGEMMAAELSVFARKHSNFSGEWHAMDLCGVAEQLAAGVAYYSMTGELSCGILRGGRPIGVTALGSTYKPVTSSINQVFIPRLTDSIVEPSAFAVMSAAVNACGAQVVTDVVEIDTATHAVLMPDVTGGDAAAACVDAIRILMANYEMVSAGQSIAYAIVRGLHRMLSVVGHTDEGALMRDVLRRGRFPVPFGGIHFGRRTCMGLPCLAANTQSAAANWADSLALASAASVAHCDPCVVHNGAPFPTVLVSRDRSGSEDPSTPNVGGEADAESITTQFADDIVRFAPIWIGALGKMFCLPGAVPESAVRHLQACGRLMANLNLRHARFKAVAPYYWIEPTSLIPEGYFGTFAEVSGFGARVTSGRVRTHPGFERIKKVGGSGPLAIYQVEHRSARTSALLTHLVGNPKNGLSNLSIRQADPHSLALVGSSVNGLASSYDRMLRYEGFDSWMWTRGQSPIPAPSEFMNTAVNMNIAAVHGSLDLESMMVEPTHLPAPQYMESIGVTFVVSKPRGVAPDIANRMTQRQVVARSRGIAALEMARRGALPMFASECVDMPIRFEVPGTVMTGWDSTRPAGLAEDAMHAPAETNIGNRPPRGHGPSAVREVDSTSAPSGQGEGVSAGPSAGAHLTLGARVGPREGPSPSGVRGAMTEPPAPVRGVGEVEDAPEPSGQ